MVPRIEIAGVRAATPLGEIPEIWQALCGGSLKASRDFWKNITAPGQIGMTPERLLAYTNGRRERAIFATTKGYPLDGIQPFAQRYAGMVVSNACVSGAQAVIEGIDAIADDDCDVVVVNAGDCVDDFVTDGFASLQAMASAIARPFDRRRDGLTIGTGDATVIFGRTHQPTTNPCLISYGCSNDANHISGPSRDGAGLALAIERALVGIDRREIRAICAHGTATQYNDAMEARAFHAVFNGSPPPVFGIKGAIGHTLGAAGLIEVIISARVATEGVIPPTVGYEHGEDDFPLDVVHGKPRKIKPGLVLTTNSGFGGMNTAIVIGPGSGT